jgi:hypothetical protein
MLRRERERESCKPKYENDVSGEAVDNYFFGEKLKKTQFVKFVNILFVVYNIIVYEISVRIFTKKKV